MRYLPLSDADRSEMLARIGVATIDDLFADIPADKLLPSPVASPDSQAKAPALVRKHLTLLSA